MREILQPVPPKERQEKLLAYQSFLLQRDGEPNFSKRTLSLREASMPRFEAPKERFLGAFDVDLFESQHHRYDPSRYTPPEMQLLLCFVKINANEAYAVEQVSGRPLQGDTLRQRLEQLVLLEEHYHTRLLLSASALFGVTVKETVSPSSATRSIVAGIAKLPEIASRPITLAGEAVGIMTFLRMIGAVRRLFQGELRDTLEERVTEVLIDEVGHLSLNRLLAAPGTFAALRAILPAVALGTRGALPEAEALGILPLSLNDALRFDLSSLPQEVRQRAFVA